MKALLLIATFLMQAVGQLPNQMGVVTGRLTRNGQPAANVRVSAMVIPEAGVSVSDVSSLASVVLTDSDGRYRLENVPPGRYYVTAGFLDIPTYYPGVASISSAKAVNVEAGSTTTGIDFTTAVSTGTTVSGRVVYPPGQSVPANLKVSLVGNQRPAPESFVQPDGSFEVPRVRPGNYTLRVPPWATTVVVGDSDISAVDIEVPYNVAGTVTVENGGLLPNMSLSLISTKPGAEPQNITLSPTGAFSSQLTPGDYRLAVSGLPPAYSLKAVNAGSADLIANHLKVLAGTPPAPINIELGVTSPAPWVKVSGNVGGPGFVAGPRYAFTLTGKGLVAPIQALLSTEGAFEIPRVLPGDYILRVNTAPARSVEIHVGSTDLSGIEITIPPTKEVTANITVEGQQAVASFSALLNQQVLTNATNGTAVWLTTGSSSNFELALTDQSGATMTMATRQADGTFRVRLPEGERTVKAEVTGYTLKSLSYGAVDLLKDPLLKVSSAETSQVQMTLAPSPQAGVAGTLVSSLNNTLGSVVRIYTTFGGAAGGVVSYSISGGSAAASTNTTVYIGPDIAQANLLSSVPPTYPAAASSVKDTVVLRAEIDKAGTVTNVSVVRGHPLLNDAAIAAVKQWRYRPQVLNGQPTAVVTTIRFGRE
jgi:TonB family protein